MAFELELSSASNLEVFMFKQLSWKGWSAGLACGIGCGLALTMLVAADAPEKNETGRYQLQVWAHAGSTPGDIGKHGAYRLDTQTGEVWIINGRDEAHKLEFKPQ
jgi:hypothetical protein